MQDKKSLELQKSSTLPIDQYTFVSRGSTDPRVRSEFNRYDYYSQRPHDIIPKKFPDIIRSCRAIYLRTNVVRNVIDMMTDFACEGLKIIHPDKSVEAFFKVWAAKVKLADAIDEFVKHFFIDSNVVVKRTTAKLSKPVQSQWMERAMADQLITSEPEKLYVENQVAAGEIPWRYHFLNVAALFWQGGEQARITGDRVLAFRPSTSVLNSLRDSSLDLSTSLPTSVIDSLKGGSSIVPLDMNSIYVCHSKKDSWEDWAPPFLYCILDDVKFKNKLRQAENAALDGLINVTRLWKLGDHKAAQPIFPSKPLADKLIDLLENNTGGGAIDIVWDSMIEMEEFYPPIAEILGPEKYTQVDRDILIGLGIPEVLIGGSGSNFSNSFIQLKTLIERLNYVRRKVKEWIYGEIHLVCQAMDIPIAPKIRFNEMNLEDQNIARKLIVGLLDRGIISVEAVLQVYGEDFLMEVERMRGEQKIFKESDIEVKGPFDQPQPVPGTTVTKKKKGQPGQGRPSQTNDVGRKTRTPKPRRSAAVVAVQKVLEIDNIISEMYMESEGVSNARKLTHKQREDITGIRQLILSCIKIDDKIDKESVATILENNESLHNQQIKTNIQYATREFIISIGRKPNLSEQRTIEAMAWADYFDTKEG